MAIVPRWARAKVLKAKRNRRSTLMKKTATQRPAMQTMQYEDDFGKVVRYRDHVRSYGSINQNAPLIGKDTVLVRKFNQPTTESQWHGYPVAFVAFLSCFDKVPDDQLPPLVALTRKRKKEWQSAIKGQGKDHTHCLTVSEGSFRHIFCFLSGKTAYFVWLSKVRGLALRSVEYTSDYARLVIEKHRDDDNFNIETHLKWVESVAIPQMSAT